jgi:hypothetical protein
MPEINWQPVNWPEKSALLRGIKDYVRTETGIANLAMPALDRLNLDDLALLAMTMGYTPDPRFVTGLRARFDDQDRHVAERRQRWDEDSKLRAAQRATANSILAMSNDEVLAMAGLTLGGERAIDEDVAKIRATIDRLTRLLPNEGNT